jgi:hypothetical protein
MPASDQWLTGRGKQAEGTNLPPPAGKNLRKRILKFQSSRIQMLE